MQDETFWISEPWQVTAQKKLIAAHLMIVDGAFSDAQHFASELSAIAEMIAGMPSNWIEHITDGGCFPEELK